VLIPYLLSNLGMGGGQGVRNPIVVGGYGRPQRLILGGFGVQPVHTGDATLASLHVLDAAGTFSVPVYTGSASLSTPGRVLSGDGNYLLEYVGDGSTVVVHAVQGEGTFEAPIYTGSGSFGVRHSFNGQGFTGTPTFTGSTAVAIKHILEGTGLFSAPTWTGGASVTCPHSLLQGVGTFSPPIYSGSAALVVPHRIVNGSGSLVVDGGHALAVVHHLLSGAGTFTPPSGPATFREAVLYRLSQVPGLADLVGDRVYFGGLPQGAPRPAVTFSVASRTFGRVLAGPNRTSQARVRIGCWADKEKDAALIADEIRLYFDGFAGKIGQVYIYMSVLENEIDLPEPGGEGTARMIYQVLLDYSISHKITLPVY